MDNIWECTECQHQLSEGSVETCHTFEGYFCSLNTVCPECGADSSFTLVNPFDYEPVKESHKEDTI